MTEPFTKHLGIATALNRRAHVAKFEATTGRLIWWRHYKLGGLPGTLHTAREIVPIHGTDDVAVWMRGVYLDDEDEQHPTDYLLRVPACGGDTDCLAWVHSLSEEYFNGDNPFAMPTGRPQNDLLHAAANGDTYAAGGFYLDEAIPPTTLPWVKGFASDGDDSTNFNLGVTVPAEISYQNQFLHVRGIPSTSDLFFITSPGALFIGPATPSMFWITGITYRVGPGGSSSRHFLHSARPICANAAGELLYSFRTVRPYGVGQADLRGIVVSNHTGADVSLGGYSAAWLLDITPTDVTLLDNSIVAQLTDSFLQEHNETVAPVVCVPQVGCAHGSDWLFTNDEEVGGDDFGLRRTDASLATIWHTPLADLVGSVRQVFTDDTGIYLVPGIYVSDTPCGVLKLDHNGNVIYGLTPPFPTTRAACLDDAAEFLYVVG